MSFEKVNTELIDEFKSVFNTLGENLSQTDKNLRPSKLEFNRLQQNNLPEDVSDKVEWYKEQTSGYKLVTLAFFTSHREFIGKFNTTLQKVIVLWKAVLEKIENAITEEKKENQSLLLKIKQLKQEQAAEKVALKAEYDKAKQIELALLEKRKIEEFGKQQEELRISNETEKEKLVSQYSTRQDQFVKEAVAKTVEEQQLLLKQAVAKSEEELTSQKNEITGNELKKFKELAHLLKGMKEKSEIILLPTDESSLSFAKLGGSRKKNSRKRKQYK